MADIKTRDFSAASAVSILDPQLRKALAQVGTGFDAARRAAIDEVSPELWDDWREEARQIKIHALDHLDYYTRVKVLTRPFAGLGRTSAFVFLHCVNEVTPDWRDR